MSARIAGRISGIGSVLVTIVWLILGSKATRVPAAHDDKQQASDLFKTAKAWKIDLELSAAEYRAMQPAPPAFPGGRPKAKEKKDKRPTQLNRFGTAFPWVEGNVTANGTTLKKVGIRYSGDITYFVSTRGLKRPMTIQFDSSRISGCTAWRRCSCTPCRSIHRRRVRHWRLPSFVQPVFPRSGRPSPRSP